MLIAVRIVRGRMEDRYADVTGGIDYHTEAPQRYSPMNISRWGSPFGWNIAVLKVIFGGKCGYSGGNIKCAL